MPLLRSFRRHGTGPFGAQPVMQDWPGLIEAYRAWLPVSDATPVVTLREGATPLIPAPSIAERIGRGVRVFLKYDGLNPTGSFKDRGMTDGDQQGQGGGLGSGDLRQHRQHLRRGRRLCAPGRHAGLRADPGWLRRPGQAGPGPAATAPKCWRCRATSTGPWRSCGRWLTATPSPWSTRSIPSAFRGRRPPPSRWCDALGEAPDWLCIPVGNAGNISAYWMGFREYRQAGRSRKLPRMMGFQAAGAAPLVLGHTVEQPDTIATAIRIGNPVNKENALKARAESNGDFMAVTDAEIIEAYKLLGAEEGVFCEPASAASVAGLLKRREEVPSGATVVCVLTGNGLKDPTTAIEHNDAKFHAGIEPDTATVAKVMGF